MSHKLPELIKILFDSFQFLDVIMFIALIPAFSSLEHVTRLWRRVGSAEIGPSGRIQLLLRNPFSSFFFLKKKRNNLPLKVFFSLWNFHLKWSLKVEISLRNEWNAHGSMALLALHKLTLESDDASASQSTQTDAVGGHFERFRDARSFAFERLWLLQTGLPQKKNHHPHFCFFFSEWFPKAAVYFSKKRKIFMFFTWLVFQISTIFP